MIGHVERLTTGRLSSPPVAVRGENLRLRHGLPHFINLRLCDLAQNCAYRTHPYPIIVDGTPPPIPAQFFADRYHITYVNVHEQYFIRQGRIDPMWVYEEQQVSRTPPRLGSNAPLRVDGSENPRDWVGLSDPESGPVDAVVTVYRLRPGDARGRQLLTSVNMSDQLIGAAQPRKTPLYAYVSAKEHGLELTLGTQYVLELRQTNRAGGVSISSSPVITADFTEPVCHTPSLSAAEGEPLLAAGEYPQGASWRTATRENQAWIRKDTKAISVKVDKHMCEDDESGISRMEMWVASVRNGVGDISAVQEVFAGATRTLNVSSLNIQDDSLVDRHPICEGCSAETVVGVRCFNGANVSKVCNQYAAFRVDGSPPKCTTDKGTPNVRMGEGVRRAYQASTDKLQMSRFMVGDPETGIKRVTYSLRDMGVLLKRDGVTACADALGGACPPGDPKRVEGLQPLDILPLPWTYHDGVPPHIMTVYGLALQHAHTYQMQFIATNHLGMESVPCLTTTVTIDTSPPIGGVVLLLQDDADNEDDVTGEPLAMPRASYFQYSTKIIRVAARNFIDGESPIVGYAATLFRHTDGWVFQPRAWVGLREFVTFPIDLEDNTPFVVEWEAVNAAGLVTRVNSTVVTIDATPPVVDYVLDVFSGGVPFLGGREADLIAATDLDVGCLFTARDAESGIRSATWCLGTVKGECDTAKEREVSHRLRESHETVHGLIDKVTFALWKCPYGHDNLAMCPLLMHSPIMY